MEILNRIKRIIKFKPSKTVLIIASLTFSIFIFVGGIYNIMERPIMTLDIYPGMTHQWLNESILFAFFLTIGIAGGYISFRSTRYAYRPREAKMVLAIGVLMLITALICCEIFLMGKVG